MFTRRGFIRIGAASVGSLALRPFGLLPALAQNGPDHRALVCVFLYGGNDSNNTIIPMDDPTYKAYASARGVLTLPQNALTPMVTEASSGAPYAFHGKLAELATLFTNHQLAVVANVGSLVQPLTQAQYQQQQAPVPFNLFSHSDQQLQWQTSIAQGQAPTGWAGRAADYVASQSLNSSTFPTFFSAAGNVVEGVGSQTQPVEFGAGQSLQLAGFTAAADSQARLNALQNLLTLNSGMSLVQAHNNIMSNSQADAKMLGAALSKGAPLKTKFPTSNLGAQLQQVAQIIQVRDGLGMRRQIFFCAMNGFDTHTNQLAAHNQFYPELSVALAAFNAAMLELNVADNVTLFTESDFSRTLQPTSGGGSDHAWGSHHLALGGAVQGGRIYGKFPTFQLGGPDDADTRGRWIPTTSVDQYGATLCSWFGVPDSALPAIFPNFQNFGAQKLGFLG